MGVVLRGVRLRDGTVLDLRLADGVIAARGSHVESMPGDEIREAHGYLALPGAVEPHAHLDKALTADRVPNPTGDLLGAIEAWQARHAELTVADIAERAERAARINLANGCTLIRTHVDVATPVGLRGIEALLDVKRRLNSLVDIEIVALVGAPSTGPLGADHRALAREALDMGADVMGGCPMINADPAESVEWSLALAAEFGRPIDLHIDETLDDGVLDLMTFADRVVATGFGPGRVASHCVSLGMQPLDAQRVIAERVAEAGIAVVTLPQTNLFLQGREHGRATPRGLTAIAALRRAGATVAGGADNVRDPFNLMGRGDPLETASLLVMAGHLSPEIAYDFCSNEARRALGRPTIDFEVGDPAELLLVGATTLNEAVAAGPGNRWVFHRGVLVSQTTQEVRFSDS
jgi:cytosine deaminase